MNTIITVYSILLTISIYLLSLQLAKKYSSPITTPVFISTSVIIILLSLCHITYQDYGFAKTIMTYFLGPATVALAVPLYKNRHLLFSNLFPAFVSILLGTLLTIMSAIILGSLLNLSKHIIAALSIKSVTIPVASEIARIIGTDQYLVTAFVMITGMFGAMFGSKLLSILHISTPFARGLAMGTISHGIGTAAAVKEGEIQGAVSSVAMGVSAMITSLLIPWFLPWILGVL